MKFKGVVVGLGNPGEEYKFTRHNSGFLVVEEILKQKTVAFLGEGVYFKVWEWTITNETRWMVCETKTYMNLSGLCIKELCNKYKLLPSDVLVVHDELDLPFGKVKFKFNGGVAGHKGLLSIVEAIGPSFYRLRIGIGRPEDRSIDIKEYVLSPFSPEESSHLPKILDISVKGIDIFCTQGLEKAMNLVHSFSLIKGEGKSV